MIFSVTAPGLLGSNGLLKPVAVNVAPEAVKLVPLGHTHPLSPVVKLQMPEVGVRSPKAISADIAEPAPPITPVARTPANAAARANLVKARLPIIVNTIG